MRILPCAAALVFAVAAVAAFRDDDKKDAGFTPMFNGRDLTGWVNVNCAPGTFFVKGEEIITTGKPTGFLRTEKQYENFIAEFEWMHVNKKEVGNSGFFVWADPLPAVGTPYTRGIEVQVLVNLEKEGAYTSQGDLFSIHGATCKPDRPHPQGWSRCLPSERRCKGGGEWNHYKVIGKDGIVKLQVNGKEVSGLSECRPRKGYLALESEGAECHFRNLKIKELPSSHPKPEETAGLAKGFKNLFTGLDLSGWKASDADKEHWQPRDWTLHYDGKGEAKTAQLATAKAFGSSEFIVDFRFPPKKGDKSATCAFVFRESTDENQRVTLSLTADGKFYWTIGTLDRAKFSGEIKRLKAAGQWNRLHASLKGQVIEVSVNGESLPRDESSPGTKQGALVLRPQGEMDFGNLFVRELEN